MPWPPTHRRGLTLTSKRSLSLSIALAALFALSPVRVALAEDVLELKTPATCETEGGSTVTLTPGMFITKTTWERLEADYKRSQNRVTYLEAEAKVLREADTGTATTIAVGILAVAAGAIGGHYLWK